MRLTGFGDWNWEADGFWAGVPDRIPLLSVQPQIISRTGTTATYGPGTVGERTIPAEFGYRGNLPLDQAFDYLAARLQITNTSPRQLRAVRNDGTNVATSAVVTVPAGGGESDRNTQTILFVSVEPGWTALTASSVAKTISSPLTQAVSVPITGSRAAAVVVEQQPTTARSASTATVGWTLRRKYTITNNTAETLVSFPYALNIGRTDGLVSGGKARSDGNDLRVVWQGQEIARNLVDWNSATQDTLAWIVVPSLPAGATDTYEVWYGNANAGTAPTLAAEDAPAFDIATGGASRSTNAVWRYRVDRTTGNAGLGGWYLNRGTAPPSVRLFDVPGAWRPVRTFPNTDTYVQPSYSTYTASGTKYHARFDARRARNGVFIDSADGYGLDGVAINHPAGFTSCEFDLFVLNDQVSAADANAIGSIVLASRDTTGDLWTAVYEYGTVATTETSVATTTVNFSPAVKSLAFAVWPRNGTRIPESAFGDSEAYGAWKSVLNLGVDSAQVVQATAQAEETIYEVNSEYRIGGDGGTTVPYTAIRVGYLASTATTTARYAVRLNERVILNAATRTGETWNSGLTARVERVPATAIRAVDVVATVDGTAEREAASWLTFDPYVNPVTNPSFSTDATGWTANNAAGITATLTRDTATYDTAPAAGKIAITGNTSGSFAQYRANGNGMFPVNGRVQVQVAATVRTSSVNVVPLLAVAFYDEAGNAVGSEQVQATWTPVTGAWHRRVFAASVPTGATQYRVAIRARTSASGQTGDAWFDDIAVNGNELIVADANGGTSAVKVSWTATTA